MNRFSLRVSELFYLLLALSTVTVFALQVEASLPYFLCCVLLAMPLILVHREHPYRYFLLFASTALYLAYMIRPLVLLTNLKAYKYDRIGNVGLAEIVERMWDLIPLFGFFLAGICLPILLFKPTVKHDLEEVQSPLVANAKWVALLAWASLAVTLALAVFFNIGLKNVASSAPHLQFISRFTPTLLMLASGMVLVQLYGHRLTPATMYSLYGFLVATGVFELLIRGSKAGLAVIFFCWFVAHAINRNDFKMRPEGVIAIVCGIVVCCMVAFSLSNKVRYASTSDGLFGRAASAVTNYSSEVNLAESADDFTGRMCGFDGQLVVQQSRPVGLRKSFQFKNIAWNTLARVVPGMGTRSMTTGKAIAVYYQGAKKSTRFAGGVGLFGTLTLFSFGREWLFAIGFGFVIALLFRVVDSIRDPGVSTVIQIAFFYYLIQLVISGGIGFVVGNFAVVLGQAFGLVCLAHLANPSRKEDAYATLSSSGVSA